MISLFVDTSYKSMYVALIKDKQLMDYTNLMEPQLMNIKMSGKLIMQAGEHIISI